jgi:DNA topoisomerase VI subunit B
MDPKKDSIGVYVSVVSTRIPFKGTSKEYIGDDVTEIHQSVRRALIGCCQQMRSFLSESIARKEMEERRKALLR